MSGSFKELMEADLTDVFFKTGEDENGRDVSEFARTCSYAPASGDPFDVACIFDDTYQEAQPQMGTMVAKMQSRSIRILVPLNGFPVGFKPGPQDTVTIGANVYEVKPWQDDGTGVVRIPLYLKK